VSLTAESDFIFRGVSLSDGTPDASLSIDYDSASGWYAGGSATAVEFEPGQRQAALFAYVGYARRTVSGLAWEIGATGAHFAADSRYDYGEAFTGLLGEGWNARVYLSPSYFGSNVRTIYAEVNGTAPLTSVWRLFGHVGALAPIGGSEPTDSRRARFDARLGLSTSVGPAEVRLAWVGATRGGFYTTSYADQRNSLVLSAACFF
jgi:uncharacterized protein (TIGR02001 family)